MYNKQVKPLRQKLARSPAGASQGVRVRLRVADAVLNQVYLGSSQP